MTNAPARYTGTVKWYDETRGYGFISAKERIPDHEGDIFVHNSGLADVDVLKKNDEVDFKLGTGRGRHSNKPTAQDVRVIG